MLLCINYINSSDDTNANLPEEIKDFREELKNKLEVEFLRIFPDSNIPRFLERLLVEPRLQLLNALSENVNKADLNKLASSLVCIFEASGKSTRLLKWCIKREVERARKLTTVMIVWLMISHWLFVAQFESVFRDDSLNSKILRMYFDMIGKKYRTTILYNTLSKVSFTKQNYEVSIIIIHELHVHKSRSCLM